MSRAIVTSFPPAAEVGLGVKVRLMTVEPAQAEEWLRKNCENNRRVVRSRVKQYAADMRAGRWRLSDQAVSFNAESRLVNGQHRLHACVESGEPFLTLVVWNLPGESMMALDGGKKRTTDDNMTVSGREWPRGAGATVRRLFTGLKHSVSRPYSDQEVDEFLAECSEAVRFAHAVLPRGKCASAAIRAVVARARIALGERAETRLRNFASVLLTGLMKEGDEAGVLLRNYVLEDANAGGGTGRKNLYAMAESALAAFLKEQAPKKLSPATSELFPLENEGYWNEN